MAQLICDFTDPLDGIFFDDDALNTPEPYQSTPEMRENLKRNLMDEGHLEVITYLN